MKTIKKYWMVIVAGIIAFFGIFAAIAKRISNKKIDNINATIANNKQQVDINIGKIDAIEDVKTTAKEDATELKQEIEEVKSELDAVTTNKPKSVKAAKTNIVNKTTKRKPKKK